MDDIGMFYDFDKIDALKEKMPNFKITLFTIPNWDLLIYINKNKKFTEWIKGKEWVEVAVHGWTHTGLKYGKPVEGERSYQDQLSIFSKALEILKPFLPEKYGFKAPGNHYNDDTLRVLNELGFSYFAVGNSVVPLRGGFENGVIHTSHIQDPASYNWNCSDEMKLINEGIRT
jgi:predicted deacetylase